MKDGWHKIKGYNVLVKDDCIVSGESNGHTTYPYRYERNPKYKGWHNKTGVKVSTFQRSKLYEMK